MKKMTFNSDWLNPILVKEVRQFFHNKFFFSLVGGLLGLQLILLFIFTLLFSQWRESSREAGTVFMVIDTLLMYLCVLCTAIWSPMQRFTAERSSKELDFSNITLLTPFQVISGKLASSLVIWLLIAALCLPFMTIAYFFRNISPKEILLIFALGIMPALLLIQAALFCGALGQKWTQGLFIYFCIQVLPLIIGGCAAILFERKAAWGIFFLIQGGGFLLFLLLFAATTALITPPFANRMFALRLITGAAFTAVLSVFPFAAHVTKDVTMCFCCFPFGLFAVTALLTVCDRDTPGNRVLEKVPRNWIGRFCHYLLSSNRTGGAVFAWLFLTLALIMLWGIACARPTSLVLLAVSAGAYLIFYSYLAVFLHRKFPELPGWTWLLIVAVLLGAIPMLASLDARFGAEDILLSPISLFNIQGMPEFKDARFWLAPAAAWLTGLGFVIEMCCNFRKYKASGRPEKE